MISTVALASMSFANDGYTYSTGGALNYSKSKQIQMVSEDVKIYMGDSTTRVHVDFVFKNHGGATTVTMAFPDEGYNVSEKAITKFSSTVDGRPVNVTYAKLAAENEDDMKGVWTKKVSFTNRGTRRVSVDYVSRNGGSVQAERDNIYIFETGATWKGPIETMKITVDSSGVKMGSSFFTPVNTDEFTPIKGWNWTRLSNTLHTITRKNVVPNFNLWLMSIPGFGNFTINGVPVSGDLIIMGGPHYPKKNNGDVMLNVNFLGVLFGNGDDGLNMFENPFMSKYGKSLEPVGTATLKDGNGKTYVLARPLFPVEVSEAMVCDYVYLKDVVVAMGGKYTYNPILDRVELSFPK